MKKGFLILFAGMFLLDIANGGHRPSAGSGCNQPNGGKVSGVVSFQGLNCQPGQPDFNIPPCSGPYPNYKIEVYREDGTNLALTAMTDPKGNFGIELPTGNYVIYTQNGPMEKNREKHAFSIEKGKTFNLDLKVSTGIQ